MTMIFAIWHSILFSLLVVVCSNIFNLDNNQNLAVCHVKTTKRAAQTITKAVRYFLAKKKTKKALQVDLFKDRFK